MEKQVDKIVHWLQTKVKESGTKGLVVGVSGGLDSAVVAFLIKRAFPNNSIGVIMPINSNPVDIQHAKEVTRTSKMTEKIVDLTEAHHLMFHTIQKAIGTADVIKEHERMADANLRARLRMSTLYTVATNYNYLVVGTDNAAEWHTGYFTKFGDGGVDLLPIIDLTKGEVREMAAYLGVPHEVIEKKPSADLWEGQTDEAEMGTTYDVIDAYLQGKQIPEQDKAIIENMHKRTEHKRHTPAQCHLKED
ncbi:NAD(+) synthase [Virgibacillus soli]|uniref:NAD(+) synthase n=1 Tax=Paracerasibacillus soli TaxID=480284 RepID=UPI0035EA45B3